jgi:hypothetical protein
MDEMFENSKNEILLCLQYLKSTLIKNQMSIGVSPDGQLIFFKTKDYLDVGKVTKIENFTVSIDDLVK